MACLFRSCFAGAPQKPTPPASTAEGVVGAAVQLVSDGTALPSAAWTSIGGASVSSPRTLSSVNRHDHHKDLHLTGDGHDEDDSMSRAARSPRRNTEPAISPGNMSRLISSSTGKGAELRRSKTAGPEDLDMVRSLVAAGHHTKSQPGTPPGILCQPKYASRAYKQRAEAILAVSQNLGCRRVEPQRASTSGDRYPLATFLLGPQRTSRSRQPTRQCSSATADGPSSRACSDRAAHIDAVLRSQPGVEPPSPTKPYSAMGSYTQAFGQRMLESLSQDEDRDRDTTYSRSSQLFRLAVGQDSPKGGSVFATRTSGSLYAAPRIPLARGAGTSSLVVRGMEQQDAWVSQNIVLGNLSQDVGCSYGDRPSSQPAPAHTTQPFTLSPLREAVEALHAAQARKTASQKSAPHGS